MTAAHAAPAFFQAAAETNPTVVRRVGSTIARLRGNLDFTTAPAVRERLRELVSTSAKLLVIDLSGVSSSDAAGLAVLIGAQRRARARGITVCLAAPRTEVAELLRVTGLDSTLTICATLTDALPGRRHELRTANVFTQTDYSHPRSSAGLSPRGFPAKAARTSGSDLVRALGWLRAAADLPVVRAGGCRGRS